MRNDDWRARALQEARARGIDEAEVDYLIQAVTGCDRLQLHLAGPELVASHRERLDALWRRRIDEAVPLQYLLGRAHWRDLELAVGPAVLIPRPETELLVEIALAFLKPLATPRVADLGTGSGAIAIAIALGHPGAEVWAVDRSQAALAIAATNAAATQVAARVHLCAGDWFTPLPDLAFDAVVSNPPYIPTAEIRQLMPEVRLHEPHLALDGGSDGFAALRPLVAGAAAHLRPGGLFAVELMAGQAPAVLEMLTQDGRYGNIRSVRDWEGIERFAVASAWARGS